MKIGVIVNPIAGMGGKVGLKGTDNIVKRAIALGAKPIAPLRAIEFLQMLRIESKKRSKSITLVTCPGSMGEDEAKIANIKVTVLSLESSEVTTARDTKKAIKKMIEINIDLIVFVGGDGTAKDVLDALQKHKHIPVLGVPSGVKMYSGIFAVNPLDAVEVVLAFIEEKAEIVEFEILDVNENQFRKNTFNLILYGLLNGPFIPMYIQGSKQITFETANEQDNQTAIARSIAEEMDPQANYLLGPGTTVKRIADLLGVKKTLLGVDLFKRGKISLDVNEHKILAEIENWENTWIILSPIGRQGIIFGRGNQQISPKIIEKVGKNRIMIAATRNKIKNIERETLRIDTGNSEVDELLKGYIKVIVDYHEWRMLPVQ